MAGALAHGALGPCHRQSVWGSQVHRKKERSLKEGSLNPCSFPGCVQGPLSPHSVLTGSLQGRCCYYPHFTDEKAEVRGKEAICPSSLTPEPASVVPASVLFASFTCCVTETSSLVGLLFMLVRS